ncbi:MAG: aminotransferase class I/II-fold pyridoxal phosphate-dependent enzyme [Muribaculaceae bacterium]|nr:aminotransferase class I/II-fold pyridoxal phosphate-dependent enzyme [Muribaculaceae bacterium]
MRKERILLCKPHMSGREIDFIKAALAEDWAVPLGPDCDAFEEELRQFVGRHKQVATLVSGTAAIHLALIACGVAPGDEVIVQSFTFCASTNPVAYLGATPVFVDSENESWNMDPQLLEEAIRDRIAVTGHAPKAIIPVALYGMPYKITEIMEVADRYGIPVIEDAAEGFGSRYDGHVLGTFGRFGVLSFNGNKMITSSGGGALICPDKTTLKEVMWYATQARENYPYYQHEVVGYNYRLSNISACIGRAQMTILDDHIAHHKHVHELYCRLMADIPGIHIHSNPWPEADSNYWLVTATLDPDLKIKNEDKAYNQVMTKTVGGVAATTHAVSSATTDCQPNTNVEALRMALDAANIEARPLWKPMHRQPVFKNSPAYINGNSEAIFKQGICLPAGPYVTDEDVAYIVATIRDALA